MAMKIIRQRIETERAELTGDWDYRTGFIKGLETALFFLDEPRAVREHNEVMARIRVEIEAEKVNIAGEANE